ncbi:MAG TPA: YihY/virulence factor BrkB family protein [Blastocatellia bacterium]|nr:YihY/virulence factor BrkB family protein [Blastocatellia bacterium]
MPFRARQFFRIKNQTTKWRVLVDAWIEFFENDLTTSAAAISYYTMLMLFPSLILLLVIGQAIYGGDQIRHVVIDVILAYLPGTREFVRENIRTIDRVHAGAIVTCALLVLWALSWVFTVIERAINRIWVTRPRPFLAGRLLAIAMIGGLAVMLLISTTLTSAISVVQAVPVQMGPQLPAFFEVLTRGAVQVGLAVTSLLVTTSMFAVIYRVMPNTHVLWIEVLPGALITGIAWETLKHIFASLLPGVLEEYQLLYGGAWLALVLLTWVYLSSIVMLFGAQVTAVLHNRHEAARERSSVNDLVHTH